MPSLHKLQNSHRNALDELLEAEETLLAVTQAKDSTAIDREDAEIAWQEALNELTEVSERIGNKLENYAKFIENMNLLKQGLEYKIKQLQRRKNAVTRTLDWLKQNLADYLTMTDRKSVTAGEFKISKQKSAPSVVIEIPIEELPAEFHRVTIEADKNALRTAIQRGRRINGVAVVRREHIRLRHR